MTVKETAENWKLAERRVLILYSTNPIHGVMHINRMWLIPKDSKKPIDGRIKNGKELQHE